VKIVKMHIFKPKALIEQAVVLIYFGLNG